MHHKNSEKTDKPIFFFISFFFHFTIAFGGVVSPSLPLEFDWDNHYWHVLQIGVIPNFHTFIAFDFNTSANYPP